VYTIWQSAIGYVVSPEIDAHAHVLIFHGFGSTIEHEDDVTGLERQH